MADDFVESKYGRELNGGMLAGLHLSKENYRKKISSCPVV